MPHEPRKTQPFRTQRRSIENLIDDIRRVVYELGTDPDVDLLINHNEGYQNGPKGMKKIVFFQVCFKVYFWPSKDHFIVVNKYVDWFDRAIDCGGAIYKWMHGRLMNLVHGLETIEEAFGTNMVLKQSCLPESAMQRLIKGPNAPLAFEKLLTEGGDVLPGH